MKSSKKGKKPDPKKLGANTHVGTLHQRLYHALNLAFRTLCISRYADDKEREWHTNDVEVQRLVLRSISAFLDGISSETLQNPLVKDSIPDVIRAMGGILQSQNEAVLAMACESSAKMISILPSAMFQPNVRHLIHPLSSLLSNNQFQVAVTSAAGLNLIISNLSVKKEREVWEILAKADTVTQLISNLRNFSEKVKPIEYFLAMASLLGSIMQLWPSSRYLVWNDAALMEIVQHFCRKPVTDVKTTVLHMYSALALCGNGAKKLLENSGALLQTTIECMGESQPPSVRSLAFRLVQRLMANKDGCAKILSVSCKPIVKSIISALGYSIKNNERVPDCEMSLMFEACQLAMITRWPGKHHTYLWRSRVDQVLLDLLVYNFQNTHLNLQALSVQELIAATREGLSADFLLDLRPYVWEMIGWLSVHCEDDFHLKMHGKEPYLDVLITSAW
ncbi:hypothetical protein Cgig2_012617 [Carnegiea gigantea]|uniref:At1g04390 ARM repeat domain-containing protein n=1 Tax=Carnegiea gigantea TaxID=171969 RepID=A0A9Q1K135_9CARY|nr:hypothetical protein Cgig2_012617 [Carnegiea gigantea]